METSMSYLTLIQDLRKRINESRYNAARLANREQLVLYYNVGMMISDKVDKEAWGQNVLNQIATDIQAALPGVRGFSARNLRNMRQFHAEYKSLSIWQSVTAKLKIDVNKSDEGVQLLKNQFFAISFTHHLLILTKCGNVAEREFYIHRAGTQLWSVSILEHHIAADLFRQEGTLPNNFTQILPGEIHQAAIRMFQDDYLLDYLDLGNDDNERELEAKIIHNIRHFIMTMGKGFSFIGNQFKLEVDGNEFFVDLLFFNRYLQCLVAFELKRGMFKPEYIGKMNFYQNVLDAQVRLPHEKPTIGIVLCKDKNNTVVEYAIKNVGNAIGVATFRTTAKMPNDLKEVLPDATELGRIVSHSGLTSS
ncbi:MAG: DUF1016 family protein [Chitinophagaceae bacterium]|nr:MAG: DUF1016 family protein [Chitinophagaceae bacterium]